MRALLTSVGIANDSIRTARPTSVSAAAMERAAAKVDGPLHAIDDQTALLVDNGDIRVVSEGDWLLINAETDQEDT